MTKRYAEAEANFEKALAGREEQLQNGVRAAPGEPLTRGPELGVAEACRHYGILKQAQGKLEDAEALHRRSLYIFKKQLGPKHTWTLLSIADLGDISRARGQLKVAEMPLKSALRDMEEHLGESHDYTVKIYQNLGELLLLMGRKEDALGLLEKAAKGLEVLRGQNSVAAVRPRSGLGSLGMRTGRRSNRWAEDPLSHWTISGLPKQSIKR
jgi:tetratricopeptide (TPR) repeat protein